MGKTPHPTPHTPHPTPCPHEKLFQQPLGNSDANIPFEQLCQLLRKLGFDQRIGGSHHIFTKEGVE
ncbi:hypothetical protein B1L04_07000 [Microcystis aeruginosa KW]|uniref:Type II toxin-antitoxin system HicA family toxin n=1 Tax=Microcystis aeruginosa KW TaxID=1960155 RepID=A0A1V4BX99_MICAE|nr:hypothetical protein B1L04_07000 [Microcystis aeruginosa KW]